MNTTIGQLVTSLFTKNQRRFHNTELAALATHVELEGLTGVRRLRVGMAEVMSAASSVRSDAWERSA